MMEINVMRRYENEDIVKDIDAMYDAIKYGKDIDTHDMLKWLDALAKDVIDADDKIGEMLQDAEDEARDAKSYQDIYLDALHHAENHIAWLEDEFQDEIVDADKYQRDC